MKKKEDKEISLVLFCERIPQINKRYMKDFESISGVKVIFFKIESPMQKVDVVKWIFNSGIRCHQVVNLDTFFGFRMIDTPIKEGHYYFLSSIDNDRIEKYLIPTEDVLALKFMGI